MPSVAEVVDGIAEAMHKNTKLRQGIALIMQDVVFRDPDVQKSIAVALLDYRNPSVQGGDRSVYQMIRDGATRADVEELLSTPVEGTSGGHTFRTAIDQAGNSAKRAAHEALVTRAALVEAGVISQGSVDAASTGEAVE